MIKLLNLKTIKNKSVLGLISIIIAVMFYGLYGVYSRLIGIEFGAFAQNYSRSAILSIILLLYFLKKGSSWKKIEKNDYKWILAWLLPSPISMILTFIVFNNLAIGTTYFIFYSAMIVGGFIAGKMLFSERLNFEKILSLVFAFLGLGIIYSFNISANQIIYVIFAVLSGLLVGLWNSLSKKVSDKYPEIELVFLNGISSVILSFIGGMFFRESFPVLGINGSWLWIFAYAVTQIAAMYFMVLGFKNLEAQVASIIMPLEVVFATIFGYLFFGEILSQAVYLGGGLIAFAAFLPNIFIIKDKYVRR